jgi:hypothetical protein
MLDAVPRDAQEASDRMRTILFIDYDFQAVEGRAGRTLDLLRGLPRDEFRPLIVAGPGADADDLSAMPAPPEVWRIPSAESWTRDAAMAVDHLAAEAAAIVSIVSQAENAVVAAELAARWNLPWVADLPDPARLSDEPNDAAANSQSVRSLLGSAHALTVRTPAAVRALRDTLPELGRKHVECLADGDVTAAFAEAAVLEDVLDRIVSRRFRSGQPRRHLRVVSHAV